MSKEETPVIEVPAEALDVMSELREINNADWKLQQAKERQSEAKKDIDAIDEALPEYQAVERAKADLEAARLRSQELQDAKDHHASCKVETEIARSTLSELLLRYSVNHKVRTVEIDNDNRIIEIKAKVGRKVDVQLELF